MPKKIDSRKNSKDRHSFYNKKKNSKIESESEDFWNDVDEYIKFCLPFRLVISAVEPVRLNSSQDLKNNFHTPVFSNSTKNSNINSNIKQPNKNTNSNANKNKMEEDYVTCI
jgi:hypothetical protein